MHAMNITDHIQLVPADPGSFSVGVSPVDGELGVYIAVTTDNLGDFVIPVTAEQVGVLAAVCKHLLALNADEVAALTEELTRTTNNQEEENDE